MQGLIGKKLGMTSVYDGSGRRVGVTVIEAGPCVVTQLKTSEKDGYRAAQLGFGEQKESRVTQPLRGHFKKAGVTCRRTLVEFALDPGEDVKLGDVVGGTMFADIPYVDVISMTKGKGFQGVVRRHGMGGGPITHGGHSKRRIGSVGQNSYPARVNKGHRMPGHMGNVQVTQQNLRVIEVRPEENLLLINGAVPGPTGSILLVRKSIKKKTKAPEKA